MKQLHACVYNRSVRYHCKENARESSMQSVTAEIHLNIEPNYTENKFL